MISTIISLIDGYWALGNDLLKKNGCNERKRQGDLSVGLIFDELLFWTKFEVEFYQIW